MRPLSVGELLDASLSAVRRNFGVLVLCTLVAIVPVGILNTLVSASTNDAAFDFAASSTISENQVGAYVAGLLANGVLSLIAFSLATAACLRAVGGDVVGTRVGAGESLRYAARRIGPLLWLSLLYLIAILGGFVLLIVGAIWLGVMFCLSTPALLFEDKRGWAAMGRSRELISGHWWRVFGALLVMYLLVAIFQGVVGALLTGVILVNSASEVLNAVILTLVSIVSNAIVLPIAAALFAYIYFDLRVRKEGFDLQLLAQRIGPSGPAPAAAPVAGLGDPQPPPDGGGFLPPRAP